VEFIAKPVVDTAPSKSTCSHKETHKLLLKANLLNNYLMKHPKLDEASSFITLLVVENKFYYTASPDVTRLCTDGVANAFAPGISLMQNINLMKGVAAVDNSIPATREIMLKVIASIDKSLINTIAALCLPSLPIDKLSTDDQAKVCGKEDKSSAWKQIKRIHIDPIITDWLVGFSSLQRSQLSVSVKSCYEACRQLFRSLLDVKQDKRVTDPGAIHASRMKGIVI
jgi:hypothetical protein